MSSCFCTRTLPPYLNEEEEDDDDICESILDDVVEEEEEEFANDVSLVEEGELEEAREFGNDVFESILDQETIQEEEEEEEEEEIEEFANDVSEPILEEVDVSEDMEPPREWTIRLINEGHQHHQVPNQTSGTRVRRTPRMRVNSNYNYYSFVVYELEIQEEEEEDDDNYGLMDQDMSEYLETRTYYAPSTAMDIDGDPVIDEEQEVCAICLAEYKDEGTIALLQCCHEFHVECINKWLQRKKTCPFCRAPVKPTSHD